MKTKFRARRFIPDKLSDIEGVRRWQLIECSKEQSIKLYNLIEEYSKKIPNISVEDAISKLMAAMQKVFVRGRDVDIFLNSLS